MLGNSKNMLEKAKQDHYAIAQFNINNLEWTKYILETMQQLKCPVILGVSESAARYMGGWNTVVLLVEGLLKDLKIEIDVCLHLDHGLSVEVCKEAIDAGFRSVMIDASKYSLEENIKITKQVVEYAHPKGVTVEAEMGHIGGTEDSVIGESLYAKLEDCLSLYQQTGIDSLAPALGSVHGLYQQEPHLDFKTMKLIQEALPIPMVLHGGTGILNHQIKEAIACGICKININTELQVVWHQAVVNFMKTSPDCYDPRKMIGSGEQNVKKVIAEKVKLFQDK